MTKNLKERFCEVDDHLYKIVETDTSYRSFVLNDSGDLEEVNPGRVLAVGIPVSEGDFLKARTPLRSNGIKIPFQHIGRK